MTWCCHRHSRGAELYGETDNREFVEMLLKYGTDKLLERFNHANEELV